MISPVNHPGSSDGDSPRQRPDNVAALNTPGNAQGPAAQRTAAAASDVHLYLRYFGLTEAPFTITPDPRYLFLSRRHQEGMAHLLYGIGQGGSGGFVQLTGEVGTGKTTLCRCLLDQVPAQTQIALILNPVLTPQELLASICDELGVEYPENATTKSLVDCLTRHLLNAHAQGERVVVVIDEAQNMSRGALEQVRLLTNLETARDKLLQIVLLGQPELRLLLAQNDLRQLAQRITARYHLEPLDARDTAAYIRHRLAVAGAPRCPLSKGALRAVHRYSKGVPRLINIITDRALMGAYASERAQVSAAMVRRAALEVRGETKRPQNPWLKRRLAVAVGVVALAVASVAAWQWRDQWWPMAGIMPMATQQSQAAPQMLPVAQNPAALWQQYGELWRVGGESLRTACEEGRASGFICLRQSGNWQRLQRLNLPVMLRLTQPDRVLPQAGLAQTGQSQPNPSQLSGEPQLSGLLLLGIDDDQLLLSDGEQRHQVSRQLVDQHWLGEFWAVAPGHADTLLKGEVNTEVYRLKSLAAGLTSMPFVGPVDERFDPSLENWVRAFQARHGLRADGIVGPATRLYLAADALAEPHLLEEW